MAYDAKDEHRALLTYRDTGRNMNATSRQTGISKPTLYKWKAAGAPAELTGGVDWDTYLDSLERQQTQEMMLREAQEEREFLEDAKARTKKMLDTIYRRVTDPDSRVEIKPSDYDKLMRLYILLDGKEQEKIDWMEAFAAKVLQIIAEVVDNQQWTLIKARLIGLQQSEQDRMGEIPRRIGTAGPAHGDHAEAIL